MPRYSVRLTRKTTEYAWATVEVEAEDAEAAENAAIDLAHGLRDADMSPEQIKAFEATYEAIEWEDHGAGFGEEALSPRLHAEHSRI